MNKLTLFITLSALLVCTHLFGQINRERLLFEKGIENNPVSHPKEETVVDSLVSPNSLSHSNRVISNISTPTFVLYPASTSNNKHIGVVIYPGGGLVNNWLDKEGTDLAIWLSAKGINCMVVKYRTNRKDEKGDFIIPFNDYKGAIYLDARASILKMKELSDSLNIDKNRIGIMGFSAGGWLSERTVFRSLDAEGTVDWKPAFVGLIYHGDKLKAFKDIKNKIELPPFFMAVARDDKKLPMEDVIPFLSAIVAEVDKSELHIYSKGNHGFGLAYENGHSVELWKNSFYNWLLDIYNK
jgi:acetyl esterase/lipase